MFGYNSVIAEAYTQVDKDFSKMHKERRINLAFVLRIEQRHHLPANLRVVLPTGPRNERREDMEGLINSLDDKARLSRRAKCWVKSG